MYVYKKALYCSINLRTKLWTRNTNCCTSFVHRNWRNGIQNCEYHIVPRPRKWGWRGWWFSVGAGCWRDQSFCSILLKNTTSGSPLLIGFNLQICIRGERFLKPNGSLAMLYQIVLGPKIQNLTFYCCILSWRMASEKIECYPKIIQIKFKSLRKGG